MDDKTPFSCAAEHIPAERGRPRRLQWREPFVAEEHTTDCPDVVNISDVPFLPKVVTEGGQAFASVKPIGTPYAS